MPPPDPIPQRLRAIRLVFPAIAVIALIAAWSSIADAQFYARLLDGEKISNADYNSADVRSGTVAWLQFGSYVAGAVVFIRWLLPVYRYLDAIVPDVRRYEPYWAIWGWFVPVLWWWRPKQVLNDVWRAGGGSVREWPLIAWWVLFVVANVISIGVSFATLGDSPQDYHDAGIGYAISYFLDFPGALLAIVVATRATRRLSRS